MRREIRSRQRAFRRSSTTFILPLRSPSRVGHRLAPTQSSPNTTHISLPAFNKPPFTCTNEGWGEFELSVDCYITEKQKQSFNHDLHFQAESYEEVHTVGFKNPSQALQQILRETGPLPTDEKKKAGSGKKPSQKFDFEQIASALQQLEEDDLLRVIQLINDMKTPDMYIKSDVDGEFSNLSLRFVLFIFPFVWERDSD